MTAAVSSPVFSPSRITVTCKTSPRTLTFSRQQFSTALADCLSSPASSSSPLRRFQRGASCLGIIKELCAPPFPAFESEATSLSLSAASSCSCSPPVAASNVCVSTSLLKRKRPTRLNIPMLGSSAIEPPVYSDGRREVEAESARYSVYCKRGRKRIQMEDRYSAALDLVGDPQMAIFGIFDGHGGSKASEFASKNLGDRILKEAMRGRGEEGGIMIEEAVRNGYLGTDVEFLKDNANGGTCCVTAFVRDGDLIVSNAGDCRAVMSFSGEAKALTSDHRPSREDEKDRIESLGGYLDCSRGVWRLQGSLAVSRGIGDSHLKQWVTAEPETCVIKIEPECEFLILASDGLWEKVSNQEAIDVARPICMDPQRPSSLSACKKLVELSVSRGSVDDISVLIIQLGHFLKQVQ
ncbi:probable protein phosphatase 2C 2 [Phalaenopsis equestris]|uniref:probable protein phosphatase 2C 2 n=1 Tax=Phalaenopsis equestris TaxID=78828 RepID=UPI0009E3B43E|nr:probable protein phosphatase 2C 2 [Phalaenopsis equestris]